MKLFIPLLIFFNTSFASAQGLDRFLDDLFNDNPAHEKQAEMQESLTAVWVYMAEQVQEISPYRYENESQEKAQYALKAHGIIDVNTALQEDIFYRIRACQKGGFAYFINAKKFSEQTELAKAELRYLIQYLWNPEYPHEVCKSYGRYKD